MVRWHLPSSCDARRTNVSVLASGKSFFQKRVHNGAPEWLSSTVVSTPNGTTSNALIAHDMADIAWPVNMGCLGFDVWPKQPNEPSRVTPSRAKKDPLQ